MSRYRGGRRLPFLPVVAAAAALVIGLLVLLLPSEEAQLPNRQPSVSTMAPQKPVPAPGPDVSQPEPDARPEGQPPAVRGIYVTGPVAGSRHMEDLTALVEETELNAMVIDVKNDEGRLSFVPETGEAARLGAGTRYVQDLPGLVASLKEKQIYTIARIVAFKDPVLAQARPELALCTADGQPVSEGGGIAWVDPASQEVWDYLLEIAQFAVQAGFDEVQFDYVRYPAVSGLPEEDRQAMITGFLAYAREELHAAGVWLSADVFGTVIDSAVDARQLGQSYPDMAQAADFICPMVYPSHYAAGAYGLDVPDQKPYEMVRAALDRSSAALAGTENPAGVRAWLQGFTATWVRGHIRYGGEELRAQIQAVYDAGYTDWIIWNANNNYPADGLLPSEGDHHNDRQQEQ